MTHRNFTGSARFPLDTRTIWIPEPYGYQNHMDTRTIGAEVLTKWGKYSTYVVGPKEIVNAAGYVAGSEELVYIGATWRQDGGLRDRAGSVKHVLPVRFFENNPLNISIKNRGAPQQSSRGRTTWRCWRRRFWPSPHQYNPPESPL